MGTGKKLNPVSKKEKTRHWSLVGLLKSRFVYWILEWWADGCIIGLRLNIIRRGIKNIMNVKNVLRGRLYWASRNTGIDGSEIGILDIKSNSNNRVRLKAPHLCAKLGWKTTMWEFIQNICVKFDDLPLKNQGLGWWAGWSQSLQNQGFWFGLLLSYTEFRKNFSMLTWMTSAIFWQRTEEFSRRKA